MFVCEYILTCVCICYVNESVNFGRDNFISSHLLNVSQYFLFSCEQSKQDDTIVSVHLFISGHLVALLYQVLWGQAEVNRESLSLTQISSTSTAGHLRELGQKELWKEPCFMDLVLFLFTCNLNIIVIAGILFFFF